MALARRHAYLYALGIDPWVLRAIPEPALRVDPDRAVGIELSISTGQGLQIGPGDGDILLVCQNPAEAATRLAGDIARCLDSEPVWSWPMPVEMGRGISLSQAVEQRLFTRVLVFGKRLESLSAESAVELASGANARLIASARILSAVSIAELAESPAAKRALWSELCANDWCAARARNV